jgi:hypothetical protein
MCACLVFSFPCCRASWYRNCHGIRMAIIDRGSILRVGVGCWMCVVYEIYDHWCLDHLNTTNMYYSQPINNCFTRIKIVRRVQIHTPSIIFELPNYSRVLMICNLPTFMTYIFSTILLAIMNHAFMSDVGVSICLLDEV